jgi:protease-4
MSGNSPGPMIFLFLVPSDVLAEDFMARMRRWLRNLLILILLFVGIGLFGLIFGGIKSGSVLVLDLSGDIEEQKAEGAWGALLGGDITVFHQILDAIDAAKTDAHITGLVVKIAYPGAHWAKLQEVREHLLDFRKSGKPSICYLSTDFIFNKDYYVASGCEQIWLLPSSPLAVSGLMTESRFYRGIFDKLKIYPDYFHIAEYKTAANQYTEKKYTAAHREMSESLMRSTYEQFTADLAKARKIDAAQTEKLIEQGPFLASEALKAKLVDRIGYYDEVQQYFRDKNKEWRPVELARYVKQIRPEGLDKIAVVHATGAIIIGESLWTPFSGFIMGSDSVVADLRRAADDSSVKSIILRVDSPGGSAVASEIIRRAVELAQKKKPVVVSMSDVAGSGGYWIAMSANKIVADGGTLTGSIGVVIGKFNLAGFYDMIGLTSDHLSTSDNATLLWEGQNFTPAQRESVQKLMNQIYFDFTHGVAAGRHMKVEEVEKIGKGRVWTGAQAKGLGLIDEIGGFSRAVELARELGHVDRDAKIQIVHYPREKTFLENLWPTADDRETSSVFDRIALTASDKQAITAAALSAEIRRAASRAASPVQVRMPVDFEIR